MSKDLWRWHSLEELEHKSVAFDVYRQIGGDNKMRTTVMRLSMMTLFWDVMKVAIKILRHDQQLWKWKTVKSMAKFLFSKQGFIRIHVPAYKAFFRDDFHPWDIDNRPLLEHWQEKLTPVMAAA
jgi:predicted metal-dependent hydrolase